MQVNRQSVLRIGLLEVVKQQAALEVNYFINNGKKLIIKYTLYFREFKK